MKSKKFKPSNLTYILHILNMGYGLQIYIAPTGLCFSGLIHFYQHSAPDGAIKSPVRTKYW